ncbi:MAG: putative flippase AglR [Euryarchaeota archaeon]|nr:putative flippase AglR [Euryarchaeota archaeon]
MTKKIVQNITLVLSGNIIFFILGFIYFAFSARYFDATDFGIISFAMAINSLLAVFIAFGTNIFFIREVAKNKSTILKIIPNSMVITFILGAIAFIALTLYLKLFNYKLNTIFVINIFFLSTIVSSIKGVLDSIFQGLEKPIYTSVGNILNSILLFLSIIVTQILNLNVIQFSILYLLVSVIILSYFLLSISKFVNLKNCFVIDLNYIKFLMKESWPFAITYTFVTIYVWTDSIMLSIFKSEAEVGYYNIAYKMVLALLLIPTGFNTIIYPLLSRYYVEYSERVNINGILHKYFSIMLIIGVPIGVGTTILGDRIIDLIFGPKYTPAAIALQILIWSLVFTYMNAPFVKLFESINLQLLVTKITGFSAFINVGINYLLVPRYSLVGSSVATLITEAIVAISLMTYAIKLGYFKIDYTEIIKVLIASMLMGLFIVSIYNWNLILSFLFAMLFYFIILYMFKTINRSDINFAKSLLDRR